MELNAPCRAPLSSSQQVQHQIESARGLERNPAGKKDELVLIYRTISDNDRCR